ncbi:hypothetical protein ACSLO9_33535, partial [Escherichia coli]
NESKVKQLLQIRMDELAKLVGQSSVQKSVLSAYGDQLLLAGAHYGAFDANLCIGLGAFCRVHSLS